MDNDLERFLIAQQTYYRTAWYYAIKNMDEAKAYMEDYTLGTNLIEISQALLEIDSNDALEAMGWPDNLKLKSSMTLFALAKPECGVFRKVLDKFFGGEEDQKTVDILSNQ